MQVIDKAKGVGGRASNRRYNKSLSFDHGLQFISPKKKEFQKFISEIEIKKILKKWPGKHLFLKENLKNKYIGKNGNNDISKYLLKNISCTFNTELIKISNNLGYWTLLLSNNNKIFSKNLILTCPFPQVKFLAKKYLTKKVNNLNVKMQPNITVMCAFNNSKKINIISIKFKDNIISWASNENSKKRFKKIKHYADIKILNWSKKNINLYTRQGENL